LHQTNNNLNIDLVLNIYTQAMMRIRLIIVWLSSVVQKWSANLRFSSI